MSNDEKQLLDADTIAPMPVRGAAKTRKPVPTLTILAHPQASRVGETYRLPIGATGVSRAEPRFSASNGSDQPLLTPFLSRKPVSVLLHRTGADIDVTATSTAVTVDGVPVSGSIHIDSKAIDRGVVVEFGDYVVLLLHRRRERAPSMSAALVSDFGLVGDSDGMHAVRQAISRLAGREISVLIRGETGSGKELVAAALHRGSTRVGRPYVVANMAAIPSTLAASELFGHARGAFSGARDAHDGFFVRADRGTLFLDEVGDTPDDVQAALLRVLESGEVQAVGAAKVRRVDVRVVAATDADVEGSVAAGKFRGPVYYRLAQAEIHIPPLRERRDDIARLFIHLLRVELRQDGRAQLLEPKLTEPNVWLPAWLMARLVRFDWPGNVRQLRNVAVQLAGRDVLTADDPALDAMLPSAEAPQVAESPRKPRHITPDDLARVMREVDYKLGAAADRFGISRPALNKLVDGHPSLQRAERLGAADIVAGLRRAEASGQEPWRVLQVSKRGLARRRKALGLSSD